MVVTSGFSCEAIWMQVGSGHGAMRWNCCFNCGDIRQQGGVDCWTTFVVGWQGGSAVRTGIVVSAMGQRGDMEAVGTTMATTVSTAEHCSWLIVALS
ncbi:hypothetical protein GBA52_026830 [Prunus armeniaca]|nr:hypothetical protein GBA52_026830 [Prunus armeniaca]